MQSLLFHLCLEVNRVGGHALPKVTLVELLKGCLDQVLGQYEMLTRNCQGKVCVCVCGILIFAITSSKLSC